MDRVIVNGGVIPPEHYERHHLLEGDEILVIPAWGIPAAAVIPIIVGLALSIATTALSYLLFPPPKAHNIQQSPEEPTYSFEGIRTAVGPGAPVPVIYGRQRVGGQLLSSSVDQVVTILDDGTAPRRIQAAAAPATLSLLLALGEGPVSTIDPLQIQINGQPYSNFVGVIPYTNLGSADQAPLPTFGEAANTFADGREIPEAVSVMTYTTTASVHAFVLNITFDRGLYAFNPRGEKVDNVVRLQYRYRVVGQVDYYAWSEYEVVAARTSVVRFGIRKEGLFFGAYDIQLQVTFVQSVTNAEWVPTLESVTEIQVNTQSYPNTALLGLRALATDTLQGALPNITVEILGRLVRVGSFGATLTWSDNPAWCVMDFLTNTRYGLGIPDGEIDLAGFQVWATYCDQDIGGERRHTFNYTLDRDVRAQQALLEMMGGSRSILFKSEGLWTPRPTRNELPEQLISWANCTDLKLTYTRDQDRVNVIEARFANEEEDFQQDVLTWPTIEHWPSEVRKASIEVRGVTKPSRVMRAMQFELNRRRFENLSLEMTCALDAIVLQPHDLFRFSHPLPGWGTSGRVMDGSTVSLIRLDVPVTFSGAQSYIVYVRHEDGSTEVKPVAYPGDVSTMTLTLITPLATFPVARNSLWAFGYLLPPVDTATKIFRVVRMQRMSDTTVRIQAMVHNPSIYDEADAVPLPIITDLFNPLGPPPALTSLVLREIVRIQTSGHSLRVVNVSWDVGPLTRGFAPYGGALILRRTVMAAALGGSGTAGGTLAGELRSSTDSNDNFMPLTQVNGHVLDWDDYTVSAGVTYVYRVVPMSQRGVPNNVGALEATIHVAGPTTPGYFPGRVRNLRLRGKQPGETVWEGRDVHLQWEPVADTGLFTSTFFVLDYVVEVWAPGQTYLMRHTSVPTKGPEDTIDYTYTLEQNIEDQTRSGQQGARRDLQFNVWARTNTGLLSDEPASITVVNPPPDMSNIIPECQTMFGGAVISWDQYFEPRDFEHYEIHLDTITPPIAIYLDLGFTGPGRSIRKIMPQNLTIGITYYVYILPYDTFGPGIPSQINSFVPASLTGEDIDTTPPAVPTGLALATGTTTGTDGTIIPYVEASWNPNIETDMSGYEVHFRLGTFPVPETRFISHPNTSVRLENVPGGITIYAKVLAYDHFQNKSDFTAEVSIGTGVDVVPPGTATGLTATGSIKSIALLWTPPADLDYSHSLVYAATTNNRATAAVVGSGQFSFVHDGLGANDTRFYWVRTVDTSNNLGPFHPLGETAGVSGTAGQLDTTYIQNLAAEKILAGILQVFVQLSVAGSVYLDGVNSLIYIYDRQPEPKLRAVLGKLGPLGAEFGLQLLNSLGQIVFDARTGMNEHGIEDSAITAGKIRVGAINAGHLTTTSAVITATAQMANAIIGDAQVSTITVNKVINGVMANLWNIGVGNKFFIDGFNSNLYVYDAQFEFPDNRIRVLLGRVGSGVQDYGLRIWDASGTLQWDFTGVRTAGITPGNVTTPTVAGYAITKTATMVAPGQVTTDNTLTSGGAIAIGPLASEDRVHIIMKVNGQNIGSTAAQLETTLREDDGFGSVLDVGYLKDSGLGTVVMQGVFIAPVGGLASKTFVLIFRNAIGTDLVGVSNRSFVATLLQR
jgi:hypothetical protein